MSRKAPLLSRRRTAGALALLTTVLALGYPGSAWAAATQSDTQTVSSNAISIPGVATSSAGGIAIPGLAIALGIPPIVVQGNIQVDTTGNVNNVQDATNDVTIDQQTVAAAGSATASNGGVATSGIATASSTAIVMQMNIQVITGFAPVGGVTQTASNIGDIDQTTGAASGNTDADCEGSTATSGNAAAHSSTVLNQSNVQTYRGSPNDTAGATQMSAANTAASVQHIIAATGIASAAGGGTANSGNASNTATTDIDQQNDQTANE